MQKKTEIPNDVERLKALVVKLLARVEQLETENAELKRRLDMNSSNSHKPPSSDGLKKVKKKTGLPKEAKAKGGQQGHQGKTLEQVAEPEHIELHLATGCSCCGRKFTAELAAIEIVEKRQVFDLPPARLEVTEHRLGKIECCGKEHQGVFPSEVKARTQYGPGVNAFATMLSVDYKIPLERISLLFADRYGYELNSATVLTSLKRGYDLLAPTEASIKHRIIETRLAHFDETGIRCDAQTNWLHTASTADYTHLFMHKKRGKEALECDDSVLKDFKGIAVHDCWASYFSFTNCRHVLCGAHLLRELNALMENGSRWARAMHAFLIKLYQQARPLMATKKHLRRYHSILKQADKEEPPPQQAKRGRPKQSVGRCLLNRLKKYQDGVLAFAFEDDIPFSNNQAERDIRPAKVKQKITGGFRTQAGAKHYVRIQAVISTLRKQGLNTFDELRQVFAKNKVLLF